MFVGTRKMISLIPSGLKISFGNNHIIPSTTVKNLGVHMDQYILYDIHINYLSRKINGILMFFNCIKNKFTRSTRITMIETLVLSRLNYCLKVWGMTTQQQLNRVQRLENFAGKVALGGVGKYDHATPVLHELNWLNINNKRKYDICIFMCKICNSIFPE